MSPGMMDFINTHFKTFSPRESPRDSESHFTLFPTLPVELRLKIWAFCYRLQGPRIVEVRTQEDHDCSTHSRSCKSQRCQYCPRFSPSQPILVNTCHESRAAVRSEALRLGH